MIHDRLATEPELLAALNTTPTSWIIARRALLEMLFITLGRIFDANTDAFSADVLLKTCISNIEIFNKDNLRKRKLDAANNKDPAWLDDYIQNSYEPIEKDFQYLRGELAKQKKVFERVYRPIRHKLIAHKDKDYLDKSDELWKETNIDELEGILWFLHDLKKTLSDAYLNGKRPILQGKKPDLGFYNRSHMRLLDNIKNITSGSNRPA
jgi:hypothetical protein